MLSRINELPEYFNVGPIRNLRPRAVSGAVPALTFCRVSPHSVSRPSPDRYAVLGHPVAQSLSPRIHALFAEQMAQCLEYRAVDVPPEDFAAFWGDGPGRNLAGANITLPLKHLAFELVDQCSPLARQAGSVNTILRLRDGSLRGDNTDGIGLLRDLDYLGWPLTGRRVLLIGAGGAARGVLGPILARRPALLTIANRTPARARELGAEFGAGIAACSLSELAQAGRFDTILHASSVGYGGSLGLPASLVDGHTGCYDLSYGKAARTFLNWARKAGAGRTAEGLGMLVEQAAESFYLWRGVRPDPEPIRHLLMQASG